jgi:conjugative transfer signal peptidase TraF
MRLPGPTKEGQGEAQRITAPGAMLIFIAGQSPIFGKQLLYFQDPVLQKRSAIKTPHTLFTIEHDGNILSPGKLYRSEISTSTRGLVQSSIHVQTAAQLVPPSTVPATTATASSASGGLPPNISSDKQIPTTPQVFEVGEDEMEEHTDAAPAVSQTTVPTDEMQEIFAQLDEGMEEMDRNFHISELQRNMGAANSLAPGFYRIVQPGNGSDLLICPTGIAEKVSIEREYRVKSFGCGDGYAPLLKPIAARAGDTVTVSEAGVAVNGKLLPNSKQYPRDGIGRPMPLIPLGTYAVLPGTVWVISSYNRFSFDSRYFGAIHLDERVQYAKPFWLF